MKKKKYCDKHRVTILKVDLLFNCKTNQPNYSLGFMETYFVLLFTIVSIYSDTNVEKAYTMWKETSQIIFETETIRILYQKVIQKKHDIREKKRLSSRNSVYVTE